MRQYIGQPLAATESELVKQGYTVVKQALTGRGTPFCRAPIVVKVEKDGCNATVYYAELITDNYKLFAEGADTAISTADTGLN